MYLPLAGENYVRLVVLQPSENWDDEIRIELRAVSLDDKPDYVTISYVWGDPRKTKNIIVNGQVTPVRQNLERVLRRLRSESLTPQQLWIDAVSINQSDLIERAQQINVMGEVYKGSRECMLWMGEIEDEPIYHFEPLDEPDPYELAVLKEIIQRNDLESPEPLRSTVPPDILDVTGAFEIVSLLAEGKHLYEMPFYQILPSGEIELSERWGKAVYALSNILRRTWWKRLWTAQEAFLPRQARIRVGSHSSPFRQWPAAARTWNRHVQHSNWFCCNSLKGLWIGHNIDDLTFGLLYDDLAPLIDALSNPVGSVAHNIFMLSISRGALLPHDRVYGILGMVREFFKFDDVPDYKLDLAQLYASTTARFMTNAKHLCLLPYARPFYLESYMHELPSWAPNWNTHAWDDYFDIYNFGGFTADSMMTYEIPLHSSTILKVEGVAIDVVSNIGRLIKDMKTHPENYVPVIEEWLEMVQEHGLSPRALWEIIHVATHKDLSLAMVNDQEVLWEFLKEYVRDGTPLRQIENNAKGTPQLNCLESMRWLDKRHIFTSQPASYEDTEYRRQLPQGSIGMSLPYVQLGDLIYVVKGARTPLLLRPVRDQARLQKALESGIIANELDRCFTFVGVVYMYGMMQGQAISDSTEWSTVYVL